MDVPYKTTMKQWEIDLEKWRGDRNLYKTRGKLDIDKPMSQADVIISSASAFSKIYRILVGNNKIPLAFVRWYFFEIAYSPKNEYSVIGSSKQLLIYALMFAGVRTYRIAESMATNIIDLLSKYYKANNFSVEYRQKHNGGCILIGKINDMTIPYALDKNKISRLKGRYTGDNFNKDCFAMVHRYNLLGGAGFQGALPYKLFDYLQKTLKVDTECFASPLNATLPNYHSAFIDTDKIFGSRGSFFDAEILEGGYEVNPPFTEELLQMSSEKIIESLDNCDKKLRFVVIYPYWDDSAGYKLLIDSKYVMLSMVLRSSEHIYRSKKGNHTAMFDSVLIILQTDNADTLDKNVEKNIRGYFN